MSNTRSRSKISGFTLIRNGFQYDFPFIESLRSLLPLVDELIINVGIGSDLTLKRIQEFAEAEGRDQNGHSKVKWFESDWQLDDPVKKKGGQILSEQTNRALEKCSGDWCIYLQADEVLHESDHPVILQQIEELESHPEVEGILFDYLHFYGSYDVIQRSRGAYRREVRIIRGHSKAKSVGDAQSFRTREGKKLQVVHTKARIFHYGWVRPPEVMREKTFFFDQLYHGDPSQENALKGIPHTGDNYRYKRIWGLTPFQQTHPTVMKERIGSKNWHWDLSKAPYVFSKADGIKILLDLFEWGTGYRLFEYKNYRLIRL